MNKSPTTIPLNRTTSTNSTLGEWGDISAGMDIKSSMFRNILLKNDRDYIWDMSMGWFITGCLANIPFLQHALLTNNTRYLNNRKSNEDNPILNQQYRNTIIAIYLGGAGYRGITNFVSVSKDDVTLRSEIYAPRSHDFDISLFLKNYKRDIDSVKHIMSEVLPIFLNMFYNEMERLQPNYWTSTHGTAQSPIKFVRVSSELESKKEKHIWTHHSGLIQVTMLKTSSYTNIRTNVAIDYVDNGKHKVVLDHIIELVFWDKNATKGTPTLIENIKKDPLIYNILQYDLLREPDKQHISINTMNYKQGSKPFKKFVASTFAPSSTPVKGDEEGYEEEPEDPDNFETPNYDLDNSPYTKYFDIKVFTIYVPILRLDILGEATISGLTSRSSGAVMPKCRQDYSRLNSTIEIVNDWPFFAESQGNLKALKERLKILSTPPNWESLTSPELKEYVQSKISSNDYSNTNYIQCKTDNYETPSLGELSQSKFKCYSDPKCLSKQTDKPITKNKSQLFGYADGHDDDDDDNGYKNEYDKPLVDNIPIKDITTVNINIKNEIESSYDNWGNEYLADGCLIEFKNGELFYNPNIYPREEDLIKLKDILNTKFTSGGKSKKYHKTKKNNIKTRHLKIR